jgi:hypothetical protein
MSQATRDNTKRRAGQTGTLIGVRFQPDALALLDAWIKAQPAPRPTRPEAIRQMFALGLSENNKLAQSVTAAASRPAVPRPAVGRGER